MLYHSDYMWMCRCTVAYEALVREHVNIVHSWHIGAALNKQANR